MQAGYFTLDSTASERYKPPKELEEFLEEHHPIYIGFGSLVVDDPEVCQSSKLLICRLKHGQSKRASPADRSSHQIWVRSDHH